MAGFLIFKAFLVEVVTNGVAVLNPNSNKNIKLRCYEGGNLVYMRLMTRARGGHNNGSHVHTVARAVRS